MGGVHTLAIFLKFKNLFLFSDAGGKAELPEGSFTLIFSFLGTFNQ